MTDPEQNPVDELDDEALDEVSGGAAVFGSSLSGSTAGSANGTITGGLA